MSKFNLKIELENLWKKKEKEIKRARFAYKKENIGRFRGKMVSFYYIKINICEISCKQSARTVYKLGITARKVEERIREIERDLAARYEQNNYKISIDIIDTAAMSGFKAVLIEGYIHSRLGKYKINFKLLESGNSEVYRIDIFNGEP